LAQVAQQQPRTALETLEQIQRLARLLLLAVVVVGGTLASRVPLVVQAAVVVLLKVVQAAPGAQELAGKDTLAVLQEAVAAVVLIRALVAAVVQVLPVEITLAPLVVQAELVSQTP